MQEIIPSTQIQHSITKARDIPKLDHAEARSLATDELDRMLALLETLSDEEWQLPTVCDLWNVSQMVAHLAGAAAAYVSWAEFKRQFLFNPYMSEASAKVHGLSKCQVEDRAGVTPKALLAELGVVGPKAIRTRHRLPWVVRIARVPLGWPLGWAQIGYLTDLIYTRDMWMHRLDICRATGQKMTLSTAHDGRIVELVIRDLGKKLNHRLGERKFKMELTGPAGGAFSFGSSSGPSTSLQIDALDFNWLASGRISHEDIAPEVFVQGDAEQAKWLLAKADVPF